MDGRKLQSKLDQPGHPAESGDSSAIVDQRMKVKTIDSTSFDFTDGGGTDSAAIGVVCGI